MSRRWRIRLAAAGGLWLVTSLVLASVGAQPHVGLLAAGALAVVVVGGVALDLMETAQPLLWRRPPDASESSAESADRRVWLIERRIKATGRVDDMLHADLVALTVDRLRSRHGIDPELTPEQAEAVCGPALWRFLCAPSGSTLRSAQLPAVVHAIEAI